MGDVHYKLTGEDPEMAQTLQCYDSCVYERWLRQRHPTLLHIIVLTDKMILAYITALKLEAFQVSALIPRSRLQ